MTVANRFLTGMFCAAVGSLLGQVWYRAIPAVSARCSRTCAERNQKTEGVGPMKAIRKFINDESGLETLEYAVVGAIVAAVALLIYGTGWGGSIRNTLINAAQSSTTAAL
jgi:Flp pilus assembly pilin Flp